MTRVRATAAAILATTLLLTGCATLGNEPAGVALAQAPKTLATRWGAHRSALSKIRTFTLQARIAARGSFGVTGSLRWTQRDDTFLIHFGGPFGAGAVDITGDPWVVEIRSGNRTYVTTRPEQFLLKQFGWTLPVRGLRYWALGLPAPAATTSKPAAITLNADGTAQSLAQEGWHIDYTRYATSGAYTLPRELVMTGQKTTFHIIIDTWQDLQTKASTAAGIIAPGRWGVAKR
ncbi:MAG TPA: lipoprotein insertase outer membrane protein LolB [Nevskiaceae bacterium]|nr:lipoprotein insertase outer membrane protein LolB [Nevskiaceae bacterium]